MQPKYSVIIKSLIPTQVDLEFSRPTETTLNKKILALSNHEGIGVKPIPLTFTGRRGFWISLSEVWDRQDVIDECLKILKDEGFSDERILTHISK